MSIPRPHLCCEPDFDNGTIATVPPAAFRLPKRPGSLAPRNMMSQSFKRETVVLLAFMAAGLSAAARATEESFFAEKVYPVLHAAQCVRCHSDNGVASETQLEFPRSDASPELM